MFVECFKFLDQLTGLGFYLHLISYEMLKKNQSELKMGFMIQRTQIKNCILHILRFF